jgi:Holliday junction resolvase RusA-like endonuclease
VSAETLTIVLPLPSGHLSPNRPPGSFGGRMRKARLTKRYLELARRAAEESGIESGPWPLTKVQTTYYHRQDRRRDSDNYMAMLKAAFDGVRDAGIIEDDDHRHLRREEPQFRIDKRSARVELTFTRLE